MKQALHSMAWHHCRGPLTTWSYSGGCSTASTRSPAMEKLGSSQCTGMGRSHHCRSISSSSSTNVSACLRAQDVRRGGTLWAVNRGCISDHYCFYSVKHFEWHLLTEKCYINKVLIDWLIKVLSGIWDRFQSKPCLQDRIESELLSVWASWLWSPCLKITISPLKHLWRHRFTELLLLH